MLCLSLHLLEHTIFRSQHDCIDYSPKRRQFFFHLNLVDNLYNLDFKDNKANFLMRQKDAGISVKLYMCTVLYLQLYNLLSSWMDENTYRLYLVPRAIITRFCFLFLECFHVYTFTNYWGWFTQLRQSHLLYRPKNVSRTVKGQ